MGSSFSPSTSSPVCPSASLVCLIDRFTHGCEAITQCTKARFRCLNDLICCCCCRGQTRLTAVHSSRCVWAFMCSMLPLRRGALTGFCALGFAWNSLECLSLRGDLSSEKFRILDNTLDLLFNVDKKIISVFIKKKKKKFRDCYVFWMLIWEDARRSL